MIDTSELKHLTECDRDMLKSALAWKSIANAAHNEGLCIGKGMAPNERDESGVSANQYMNAYSRMEDESNKAVLVIANELDRSRADNERLTQENAALRECLSFVPGYDLQLGEMPASFTQAHDWMIKRDAILNGGAK